jgi:hypothetical protein
MNVHLQTNAPTVNTVIDGHSLAHQHLTHSARVRLAYRLSIGAATLVRPTQSQCARLLGVGESAISMAAHRCRQPGARPVMTNAQVEKLIEKIGADRVLSALDKLTAPKVSA